MVRATVRFLCCDDCCSKYLALRDTGDRVSIGNGDTDAVKLDPSIFCDDCRPRFLASMGEWVV